MKKTKNNTKKEQIIAQVENPETVAKTTEVTNQASSKKEKKLKSKKAKAKTVELPASKSKKNKDKVVKEVAKKQKNSIKEQVVSERDVKYYYPSEDELREKYPDRANRSINDLKKAWRQDVRNQYRKLEREMNRFIQDQTSKEYKSAKKAFDSYAAKVLKPGMAI